MGLTQRHILSIRDLTKKDVELILQTAASFKEISTRPIKKVPTLRGKTVINCFFEASTRTRTSFEIAGKRLSADVVNFAGGGSALAKGESILDTVRNLNAMQPDVLVVRHDGGGVPVMLARHVERSAVINAGDGMHEHPTQALSDAMTIREAKGRVKGLTVAIIGDLLHSRVARSNIVLLTMLEAKVLVAGPRTLVPPEIAALGAAIVPRVDDAVAAADAIMMLRIQQERLRGLYFPNVREYARMFGLTAAVMRRAKPDVIVLHPGPINRGVEIDPDIADGKHSLILDQVENGIAVRMAVLYLLGAGPEEGAS
ncbi:MAG: aspartate carbamoyltransferase catalytic subunit [Deltaproteobacteria bacterium]|nr:aspartate carbamoyltransferase catalytic subunit [Deltaproteobacteria bacterium]